MLQDANQIVLVSSAETEVVVGSHPLLAVHVRQGILVVAMDNVIV